MTQRKQYDHAIDLSGLNCPLPILKTKAALVNIASGEVLRITVTNQDSVREIHAYAGQTGADLQQAAGSDGSYVLYFKKR